MVKFQFEKKVIDIILEIIKDNQEYLTKKENLPQLAKLGYMYNTLWYAWRVCWGYKWLLANWEDCEDNPKYKIEWCSPKNEEIENLIYDAWWIHCLRDNEVSWKDFSDIIYNRKELLEKEKIFCKQNKTFEEWESYYLNKDGWTVYPKFNNRKSVVKYLLCGSWFWYDKTQGFVFYKAGWAEQDISLYWEWKKAIFRKDIQVIVDYLMLIPQVEITVTEAFNYLNNLSLKSIQEKEAELSVFLQELIEFNEKQWIILSQSQQKLVKDTKLTDHNELKNLINILFPTYEKTETTVKNDIYTPYSQIATYYPISQFDLNTDKSYIKVWIEMCNDILAHQKEEDAENIEFAKSFIEKFKNFN